MDLGLKGKVAIITGGSEGIGKAAAKSLAAEGANVIIFARRQERLDNASKEILDATGANITTVSGDVTNPKDIEGAVQKAIDLFGKIDILVNNAGTASSNPFDAVDDAEWAADLDLKLFGAIRFSRQVIPHMKKQGGGSIVNVTAVLGKAPPASSFPTAISRAAGIALTKAMSKEFGQFNIRVNTVPIGLIKSEQVHNRWVKAGKGEDEQAWLNKTAAGRGASLQRVGEDYEAGDLITFLSSDRASYITGVSVNADGGASPVT